MPDAMVVFQQAVATLIDSFSSEKNNHLPEVKKVQDLEDSLSDLGTIRERLIDEEKIKGISLDEIEFIKNNKNLFAEYQILENDFIEAKNHHIELLKKYEEELKKDSVASHIPELDTSIKNKFAKGKAFTDFLKNNKEYIARRNFYKSQRQAARLNEEYFRKKFWENIEIGNTEKEKKNLLIEIQNEWQSHESFSLYTSDRLDKIFQYLKEAEITLKSIKETLNEKDPHFTQLMDCEEQLAQLKKEAVYEMESRLEVASRYKDLAVDDTQAYMYDKVQPLVPHAIPKIRRIKPNRKDNEVKKNQNVIFQSNNDEKNFNFSNISEENNDSIVEKKHEIISDLFIPLDNFSYTEADEKHIIQRMQDIKGIEQDAYQLLDLSRTLKDLVTLQGEGIDLISATIVRVKGEVDEAYKNLLASDELQKCVYEWGAGSLSEVAVRTVSDFIDQASALYTLLTGNLFSIAKPGPGIDFVMWLTNLKNILTPFVPSNLMQRLENIKNPFAMLSEIINDKYDKYNNKERAAHKKKREEHKNSYQFAAQSAKEKIEQIKSENKKINKSENKGEKKEEKLFVPDEKYILEEDNRANKELLRAGLTADVANHFFENIRDYSNSLGENKQNLKEKVELEDKIANIIFFKIPDELKKYECKTEHDKALAGDVFIMGPLNTFADELNKKEFEEITLDDIDQYGEINGFNKLTKQLDKAFSEFKRITNGKPIGDFSVQIRKKLENLKEIHDNKLKIIKNKIKILSKKIDRKFYRAVYSTMFF